jgi:heme-degrading monooxygenase HmoA
MVARVSVFEGTPEDLEEGVRIFTENVLPWLHDATGFRGWVALLDRPNERALGITFWSSEETANEGNLSGGPLRDEIAAQVGAMLQKMDLYEVMYVDSIGLSD